MVTFSWIVTFTPLNLVGLGWIDQHLDNFGS